VTKKRICIIAFKPVRTTIHVLRQIDYLSPHYDLTVIGHGEPDVAWPKVTWHRVPAQTVAEKVAKLGLYALGRVFPFIYEAWYWSVRRHRLAYELAVASRADAFHANDWQSVPLAVAAARQTGGRVVLHLHEYAEEGRKFGLWSLLVAPAIRHLLWKSVDDSGVSIDASITVCEPIAERYGREYGLDPVVVFNAPRPVRVTWRDEPVGSNPIRLVHHGFAKRGRGLHHLIEALALADSRFTLDFMLVEDNRGYVAELKQLAERLAPGRVHFRPPVPPGEIVQTVAEYDVGFCVIHPSSYNNLMMLPNKFFEYIQAGLALCVGPSPAMCRVVRGHGLGLIAESFEPKDVAKALNRLTAADLAAMKEASRRAASALNADVEMGRLVSIYRRMFDQAESAVKTSTEGSENWVH